jgi:hypothetical protein
MAPTAKAPNTQHISKRQPRLPQAKPEVSPITVKTVTCANKSQGGMNSPTATGCEPPKNKPTEAIATAAAANHRKPTPG